MSNFISPFSILEIWKISELLEPNPTNALFAEASAKVKIQSPVLAVVSNFAIWPLLFTWSFKSGLVSPIPTFPEESPNTDLLAGNVQNTSLVPAEKSTAESELELLITVVLANVSGVASVTVPKPTSNSSADWWAIQ